MSVEGDLEAQVVLHVKEGLGVAARVVDRVVGVAGLAKVFEVLEGVLDKALVEGA
jgi:hypothetical protein